MRKRLSAAFVRDINQPGKYGDMHGLLLRVRDTGSKQWIWRGTVKGKRVDLGLGGYPYTTLAEARGKAFQYRKLSRAGGNPKAPQDTVPTFSEAVNRVIEIRRKTWKPGGGSEHQWHTSLVQYVLPHLGRRLVNEITPADVMVTLLADDLWTDKPVTAARVRQRISAVLKWSIAQGYRQNDPAGDVLSAVLPRRTNRKTHFKALPPGEVAKAIAKVRACRSRTRLKLSFEFLVLTAARQAEARSATWSEIDMEARVWRVPGTKMKSGKPHRVPLSGRAIEVLQQAADLFGGREGLVFPSLRGKELHPSMLPEFCRKLELGASPLGFRLSFRDYCAEQGVSREIAASCLAQTVRNKVEAAYRRSDLLDQRRAVMEHWARCVEGHDGWGMDFGFHRDPNDLTDVRPTR